MKYAPEDLKKLQEIQVGILSEVIRICNKHGITYFTVGGTTLGAVRHNGFIPWDDDIDIGMLRPDYEKFLKIAPQELKKGYTLQHFSTDENAVAYFAKVRKDGTLFVESNMKHLKMHHGIFIDIMPHDFIPMNEKARRRYNVAARVWQELYLAKSLWSPAPAYISNKFMGFVTTMIRSTLHILLLPVPKSYVFKKTEKAMKKCAGEKTTMTSSRGYPCFECEVSDLLPTVEHQFENITVNIPADADKVLRTQYGDYMTLPPENKRMSHSPTTLKLG